jgi:spore germination cell wall hydrolase CwlJ-like protein
MRTMNRNMAVIAVLLIVLLVQVIAVGKPEPIKDNSITDVMADAGIEETLPQDDMDIVVEEEIVSAELNVVYRSPLASSDVVDEFAEDGTSSIYEDKIVSYTVNRLCVYELPDLTSKVVGVMYAGTEADIVEIGSEWTKISSGSVTGYVRNVAVIFGGEAEIIAEFIGSECSEVTANSLTVYEDASSDSTAIDTLSKGDRVTAVEVCGDYVLVTTDSTLGYVLKSGVNISFGLGKAITIEEENEINAQKAAEEAKKKAEEAAQAAKDKLTNVTTTNRGAISAAPEEIHLLAAIIYWESGWEPMEGQIAVGNVVLNRVFQSRFKQNTIADVIYAPGQFSGVLTNGVISDRFQAVLNLTDEQLNARGCYDAALVALSGVNNIGDLNFFVSVKKANYAKYTSYTIINNHCFYTY